MIRTLFLLTLTGVAGTCLAADMPQSAADMGCTNCHALNAKVVGPSWTEIAQRYRERRYDPNVLEQVIKNVSNGSRDNWGKLPMTASDPTGKKREQIVEVVKYILSLPEQPASQPVAANTEKASKTPK
jgi:cytochrome c